MTLLQIPALLRLKLFVSAESYTQVTYSLQLMHIKTLKGTMWLCDHSFGANVKLLI